MYSRLFYPNGDGDVEHKYGLANAALKLPNEDLEATKDGPGKTHEVVKVVDAPIADIWAIISAFGSERLGFPGVVKFSPEGFGIGLVRTLTFDHGTVVHERLEVADPETHAIRYLILDGVPNTTNPRGTLQLTAVDENKTQFSWSGASDWTEPAFKPVLADMLDKMFSGCIDAVAAKLK